MKTKDWVFSSFFLYTTSPIPVCCMIVIVVRSRCEKRYHYGWGLLWKVLSVQMRVVTNSVVVAVTGRCEKCCHCSRELLWKVSSLWKVLSLQLRVVMKNIVIATMSCYEKCCCYGHRSLWKVWMYIMIFKIGVFCWGQFDFGSVTYISLKTFRPWPHSRAHPNNGHKYHWQWNWKHAQMVYMVYLMSEQSLS